MKFFSAAVAAAALVFMPSVAAVPDGFKEEEILQGVPFMTDMVWTPTGQMVVILKVGEVHVYEDVEGDNPYSYNKMTLALDLSEKTCYNNERGLGGIQLHPNFEQNRWLYLYYTTNKNGNCDEDADNGPVNRLSRFVLQEDNTIDSATEEIFFDTPPLAMAYHNGGRVEFGKDGYLYVTTGDGGNDASAQVPSNLFGAMIRLTDEGEIPPENPFASDPAGVRCNVNGKADTDSGKCQELYALGLRNAFRFDMDPNTIDNKVRFMINNVGASEWESQYEGGDDVNGTLYTLGVANYGWPVLEGPCLRGKFGDCSENDYDGDFILPYHFYLHVNGGANTASAFVLNGIWPSEYDNAYLYGEFVFGNIYVLKDIGVDHCYTCSPAESKKEISIFTSYEGIVSMRFGPYTGCTPALYYTAIANGGVMQRVTYVGDGVNITCVEDLSPTSAPVPTAAPTTLVLAEEGGYPGELFPWNTDCPEDYDFCGMLEFCMGDDGVTYRYRLPCLEEVCDCLGISGPLIRLVPGNKYRLTLRNAAPEAVITNLHTHGLHIVGAGDGDDVTRKVTGGGNCLDFTWDIAVEHPGGTYWYHAHHHGISYPQVEGGAFGLLIVEDNPDINPDVPSWAANERLLQVAVSLIKGTVGNGKKNEVIDIDALQWYRLRVSIVSAWAEPKLLTFDDQGDCNITKVASDGIWRSSVPGSGRNVFELTGASRADIAIRCITPNSLVPLYYDDELVATIRVGSEELNPDIMEEWVPTRPASLPSLIDMSLPEGNTLTLRLGYDYVNDLQWDPETPIATIAYNQVHEWTLLQTILHPFHLHLYHMQVVTPGGCGEHKEGEWYDTISAPENCTVRFFAADFGQMCVLHCHVLFHEDNGSMSWVNVTGTNMPRNDVQSFQYSCPAIATPSVKGTPPTASPSSPPNSGTTPTASPPPSSVATASPTPRWLSSLVLVVLVQWTLL